MRALLCAFATASLLMLSTVAMAATIHVPAVQPTIQAGIDAASYGDTVIVACGTYCEQPVIMKSGIYLISETGQADCVTIEAQWQHFWCVIDCVDLDSSTTIQGFTITGGLSEYGAGMRCMNSSPTITNVTFIDNYSDGHGVLYCQGSSPTLQNVAFLENEEFYSSWVYGGGGMYCVASSVTLTDCTFVGNAGPGMSCEASSVTLTDCTFVGNHPGYRDCGLYCDNSSLLATGCEFAGHAGRGILFRLDESETGDCTLTDCRFVENGGGGMNCETYGVIALTLADCSFVGNTADGNGGGLRVYGASLGDITLAGCSFVGNTAEGGGGGLYADGIGNVPPSLTNCTIVENNASSGGAICAGSGCSPGYATITNTIIAFNTGEDPLAFRLSSGSSCNDFYGNEGGDWLYDLAEWLGVDGNICEDPLFCLDENPGEPYTLQENSPCAAGNNPECGQIGAWGVGCEAVTPVQATSWGEIKAMYR